MNWRPHTEKPFENAEPFTALIAVRDETDEPPEFLLLGIYMWRYGEWVSENGGFKLKSQKYWWIPESEVMETLAATVKEAGDGAQN